MTPLSTLAGQTGRLGNGREWTEPMVKQLSALWADGFSCSEIARIMGDGITRNAVIGKVHRLKLPKRRETVHRVPRPPRRLVKRFAVKRPRPPTRKPWVEPRPVKPDIAPEPFAFSAAAWAPLPGSTPISLEALTDKTCRWPVGDARLFCGCPVTAHSSYCEEHYHRSIGKGTYSERSAVRVGKRVGDIEAWVPEAA